MLVLMRLVNPTPAPEGLWLLLLSGGFSFLRVRLAACAGAGWEGSHLRCACGDAGHTGLAGNLCTALIWLINFAVDEMGGGAGAVPASAAPLPALERTDCASRVQLEPLGCCSLSSSGQLPWETRMRG